MGIIYRGSNTVYAEIKNEDNTRSPMILSLDRLYELVNTFGVSAYIGGPYRVCPVEIEKVKVDSHEIFQQYNKVNGNRYSVMASADPCQRYDGHVGYRALTPKFLGVSIGNNLYRGIDDDRIIGQIIGEIVMYGSIEDEYVYYPNFENSCILPMLGIHNYDPVISDTDNYCGSRIYDRRFYRMCTELLRIDTNPFTKTLPENILDFTPNFAQGILDVLVRDATTEEMDNYPHRIAGQLGMIFDAVYGRITCPCDRKSSAPIAGWESPRDDYGYRIFTGSGVFVTNSVLCKSEG